MGAVAVGAFRLHVCAPCLTSALCAHMGSGLMEGVSTYSTLWGVAASLPVVSKLLTFTALVRGSGREVLCGFSGFPKDGDANFEETSCCVFALDCNYA